jgi:hypothetical protein
MVMAKRSRTPAMGARVTDGRDTGVADMHRETVAVHGGFDFDPTTRAVAVPIYQTAA